MKPTLFVTVLALLLAGTVPTTAEQPTATPCSEWTDADTLRVDHLHVEQDETLILEGDTVIQAATVTVHGALLGAPAASPDEAGSSLCIQADSLYVSGIICAGDGYDQGPIVQATQADYTGRAGSQGGSLALDVPAHGVRVESTAAVCSGDGGDGQGVTLFPDSFEFPGTCTSTPDEALNATGGRGGDAGDLVAERATAAALAAEGASLRLGDGGAGGDANLLFGNYAGGFAEGGPGGASGHPTHPLGLFLAPSTGGMGGDAISVPCPEDDLVVSTSLLCESHISLDSLQTTAAERKCEVPPIPGPCLLVPTAPVLCQDPDGVNPCAVAESLPMCTGELPLDCTEIDVPVLCSGGLPPICQDVNIPVLCGGDPPTVCSVYPTAPVLCNGSVGVPRLCQDIYLSAVCEDPQVPNYCNYVRALCEDPELPDECNPIRTSSACREDPPDDPDPSEEPPEDPPQDCDGSMVGLYYEDCQTFEERWLGRDPCTLLTLDRPEEPWLKALPCGYGVTEPDPCTAPLLESPEEPWLIAGPCGYGVEDPCTSANGACEVGPECLEPGDVVVCLVDYILGVCYTPIIHDAHGEPVSPCRIVDEVVLTEGPIQGEDGNDQSATGNDAHGEPPGDSGDPAGDSWATDGGSSASAGSSGVSAGFSIDFCTTTPAEAGSSPSGTGMDGGGAGALGGLGGAGYVRGGTGGSAYAQGGAGGNGGNGGHGGDGLLYHCIGAKSLDGADGAAGTKGGKGGTGMATGGGGGKASLFGGDGGQADGDGSNGGNGGNGGGGGEIVFDGSCQKQANAGACYQLYYNNPPREGQAKCGGQGGHGNGGTRQGGAGGTGVVAGTPGFPAAQAPIPIGLRGAHGAPGQTGQPAVDCGSSILNDLLGLL